MTPEGIFFSICPWKMHLCRDVLGRFMMGESISWNYVFQDWTYSRKIALMCHLWLVVILHLSFIVPLSLLGIKSAAHYISSHWSNVNHLTMCIWKPTHQFPPISSDGLLCRISLKHLAPSVFQKQEGDTYISASCVSHLNPELQEVLELTKLPINISTKLGFELQWNNIYKNIFGLLKPSSIKKGREKGKRERENIWPLNKLT